jgi:energy-coupling factor transporter ATP-binding protein EcfA2
MILKEVKIKNYRSIKDVLIEFKPSMRMLIGKNESGKSNILSAISLLDPNITPDSSNIRDPLPNESPIDESYVQFVFILENSEIKAIYNVLKPKIFTSDFNTPILVQGNTKSSLLDICSKFEIMLWVMLDPFSREYLYKPIAKSFKVPDCWKRIKKSVSSPLSKYNLIHTSKIKESDSELFEEIPSDDVYSFIGEEIIKHFSSYSHNVTFWKYNVENILPPSIDIKSFFSNPDSCIPLRNMFYLAKINDIKSELGKSNPGTKKFRNLLERVSTHANKFLHEVWKEHGDVEFCLEPNGPIIEISIKEKNRYSFSQRSDGFKRFVSFLLMVSSNYITDKLSNSLILIDEPENSLHPSGVRYLRDELIKISALNPIVIASHSIFMIDKENIERHYIVKKKNEITEINLPALDNLVEEEILYRALGFSVYDIFKEKNIIFEGWRDKKLFNIAIENLPSGFKLLKKTFSKIGISHGEGVNSIKNITPIFEIINRFCLIISDDDKPAIKKQKEFLKQQYYGVWKRYSEIYDSCSAITGEDFIKESLINKSIAEIKKDNKDFIKPFKLDKTKGTLLCIQNWLTENGVDPKSMKPIINDIKVIIYNNLSSTDIKKSYFNFLKCLSTFIIQN